MKNTKVSEFDKGQRIDKYLKRVYPKIPSSYLYKLFRKKDVKVNGHWVKENFVIHEGDSIDIYVKDEVYDDFIKEEVEIKAQNFPYQIVYEDENLLFVNKPVGVLVHGDSHEKKYTLINAVTNYLYYKGEYDPKTSTFAPALAHRIDRNTSGLVMFAKNYQALEALLEIINDKEKMMKTYLALIKGTLEKDGVYIVNLVKNNNENKMYVDDASYAKEASTSFITLKKFPEVSLVAATLLTGRTHQIRATLSHIDHPIVMDEKYGDFAFNKAFEKKYKLKHLFLHSYQVSFSHVSGFLSYLDGKTFIAKLPEDKEGILYLLENPRRN